ncbi:MAG TPA: dynamin family protein [Rubricoccaceae bacterium]|nr:dynamin family protein [Rubricoccaceae bacterium]
MDLLPGPADALLGQERALLDRLHRLLETVGADEGLRRRVRDLADRLSALFLVVVVGEFNAGKSTVLNALFGQRVMEEGPVPTTDRITLLRHGERAETHRLGEHLAERRLPAPLLRDLTLVDTPGTNSIVREHQTLTEDFIPRADLVLFVTSYDRPLSESERSFLAFIREAWGKRLVFVLNKADLAATEADLAQVIDHVLEGCRRLMGFTPRLFPVAARLALAAKEGSPENPAADPRWGASRFGAFQQFLTETLGAADRLALKLSAPLDTAAAVLTEAQARLAERRAILERDEAGLTTLQQRFTDKEVLLREAVAHTIADVDRELLEMERRGVRFLDDTIRVTRLNLLRDRNAFREEFGRQVTGDAERRVEARAGEGVDALLRHVYALWNDTYAHLAEQRQVSAAQRDAFLYNREEVFQEVLREARKTIDAYNLDEEARRILENARATATLFAGAQAAAVGLGALAGIIIAATALDVTGGIVAAGVLAAFGFVLLPRQRRRAIQTFTERVDALRAALKEALLDQFAEEIAAAMSRVRRLVEPLEQHTAQQRAALADAATEADALQTEMASLRADVRTRYGDPSSVLDA